MEFDRARLSRLRNSGRVRVWRVADGYPPRTRDEQHEPTRGRAVSVAGALPVPPLPIGRAHDPGTRRVPRDVLHSRAWSASMPYITVVATVCAAWLVTAAGFGYAANRAVRSRQ